MVGVGVAAVADEGEFFEVGASDYKKKKKKNCG